MSLMSIFRKTTHHADLQDIMMRKLGVRQVLEDNPNGRPVMRRAVNRCLSCDSADACEKWLDSHETAEQAPSFCRNASLFERLKMETKRQKTPA